MTTTKAKSARDAAIAVAERMKARMADPRRVWGQPYPYDTLNTILGGIHPSEMTILEARPSGGKTQTMVQTAESVTTNLLTDEGQRDFPGGVVKLVLCEGTAEGFMKRWAILRSGVSSRRVADGSIREFPEKAQRFLAELKAVSKLPVEFLDSGQSLDEVVRFLTTGNTAWWALDYVQKCPLSPSRPNDGGVNAITLISGALSEVAKLKAPGLVLAHTVREVDKREDRRPKLGDIKGGSALEGDARVVLGLYSEWIYEKLTEENVGKPKQSELLILKNNDGEGVGRRVDLLFHPKKGSFQDVTELLAEEQDDDS